jgi:hypothetical protein
MPDLSTPGSSRGPALLATRSAKSVRLVGQRVGTSADKMAAAPDHSADVIGSMDAAAQMSLIAGLLNLSLTGPSLEFGYAVPGASGKLVWFGRCVDHDLSGVDDELRC